LYYTIDIKPINLVVGNVVQLYPLTSPFTYFINIFNTSLIDNEYKTISLLSTVTYNLTGDYRIDNNHGSIKTQEIYLKNHYVLNLTSLGIASLTKSQMDAYFDDWQLDEFINGITFATFQTAESYYRQTFYDPLPNNSIVLIISGLLGIGLMLLGYITKARIFNLFAIAPFITFAVLLPETPIIIAMIGLIIWQLYYTFRMD